MNKRYTLTDCYELLQVDPKTFRRWIEKASIVPQASKADDRVKYLTHDQLVELAELHERTLPETLPQQEASLAPGTYKLLLDQIEEVNQAQTEQASLLQTAQEKQTLLEAQVTHLSGEHGLLKTSVGTLQALTEHKLAEMARTVEQLRQMVADQRELYDTTQGKIGYLAGQMTQITDTINSLAETVTSTQREAERKVELLEETLRQERGVRESLAAQVATLLQKKQPTRLRQRQGAE